jgi:hypothetical protein
MVERGISTNAAAQVDATMTRESRGPLSKTAPVYSKEIISQS